MKTTLLPALSTLSRSPKIQLLTLFFILGAWRATNTVHAASPGTVVAWGDNSFGQTTVPLAAQSGVTAIAVGGSCDEGGCYGHTVALKNDGSVVAWGYNNSGQVSGTPTTNYPYSAIANPVTLGGSVVSGVTAIAAGELHTVALKNDGSVVAWGNNYHGQVTGTPTTAPPNSATANPVTLGGQVLSGVTAIAAGFSRTVALLGTVPLRPSLQARPSGNELILSWPTNAVGFTLQSTPNLTPPVTWMDSTNPPAVLGAQFTVINTLSGPAQFYRLRKP